MTVVRPGDLIGIIRAQLHGVDPDHDDARAALISEFTANLHAAVAKLGVAPTTCAWPGCSTTAIDNSHIIQKAALRDLASTNQVVGPKLVGGDISVAPHALRSATTFPGYCTSHENVFNAEWERFKLISEQRHRDLQAMRSIDGELFRLRGELDFVGQATSCIEVLEAELQRANGRSDPQVSALTSRFNKLSAELASQLAHFRWMRADLLDALNLTDPSPFGRTTTRALELRRVPVALSYCDFFGYRQGRQTSSCGVAIAVIPQSDKSLVLLCTEATDQDFLDAYMAANLASEEQCLETIEAWMLDGTHNWFASPNWWVSLDPAKKAAVMKRVRSAATSTAPEPIGIFN